MNTTRNGIFSEKVEISLLYSLQQASFTKQE